MYRFLAVLGALSVAYAADPDGSALYKQHCAACHEVSGTTRAPGLAALHQMSPDNIVRALESGVMKEQGASLTAIERRTVAEFLTGKTIGAEPVHVNVGMCADPNAPSSASAADWNGWGSDVTNTRHQPKPGLAAADVPKLKLKWAFAFPNTFVANGQPTVVGGRIFVPSTNRNIYSLDAKSGCQYWSFQSEAPVRTAISIAMLKGTRPRSIAFFGDLRANTYALDASRGELLWKAHIDDHSHATIVGAPQYYDGRLFVPVTAAEEAPAMNPRYECCSARGALVALDAATGKQIWKTYTIAAEPQVVSISSTGTKMWGPSGASIWSAPTIDLERKLIYAGTGDNFSAPGTLTSDAILAFDMDTGKIVWSKQITAADIFNMACVGPSKASCPEKTGPDFDIGASPILVTIAKGKRVLLVSQKSGIAHALDPDK
ncbi:MAG TPA: PQQ-binding-like beta-propeller repeat protein, partial [Bryobacteraceae bacterium]|nr:PQQ-binding-like beta-propeller repeat protein [Bryobacteraceae bacterium]